MNKTIKKFLSPSMKAKSHKAKAILAAYLYSFPAKKMTVIGVTGTAGKTTTCNLAAEILASAGKKVAMATTVNFRIGDNIWTNETKMTTLTPFALQSFIARAAKAGSEYLILETSSHAIDQFRNWGVHYDVVAFTNLSHEHLDYHKTMQNYRATKGRLFAENPAVLIVNRDDKEADYFLSFKAGQAITYGLNRADVSAKKILSDAKSNLFTIVSPEGQMAIDLPLPGKFNIYNALAAASIALSQKITLPEIKTALEKTTGAPGRMERIEQGQNYEVIADFAHTPDELQNVYQTLKDVCHGKMIAVLGSMGDRDKTKRPVMGALAGRFADIVIVTNEDPVTEDPMTIIEEIAKGVPRGSNGKKFTPDENFFQILDRRQAIAKALNLAEKRDIVIITGKAGEHVMAVGDKKIPWDEIAIIKEELGKILEK